MHVAWVERSDTQDYVITDVCRLVPLRSTRGT